MANQDKVHGEGNYEASRQYNQATKRFVESGKVEQAAQDAAPRDAAEQRDMERAEAQAKGRAKEEDPALSGDRSTGQAQRDATSTSSPSPSAGQAGVAKGSTPDTPQAPMPGKE